MDFTLHERSLIYVSDFHKDHATVLIPFGQGWVNEQENSSKSSSLSSSPSSVGVNSNISFKIVASAI